MEKVINLDEGELLILQFMQYVRSKPLPERTQILKKIKEQAQDQCEAVRNYLFDLVDYLSNT